MPRTRRDPDRYRLGPGVAAVRIDGWWRLLFRDPARRPVRKKHALRTQDTAEALARARALYAQYAAGVWDPWASPAVTIPLAVARDRYLAHLRAQGRKPSTVHSQAQRVGWLLEAAGEDAGIDDVTPVLLERVIRNGQTGPRAPATRYSLDRSLRAFLSWCVKAGITERSPADRLERVPMPRTPPRYLTAVQLAAVTRASPPWLADAITLAAFTGLRAGELAALTWADVDLDGGWITVRRARWGNVTQAPKGAGGSVPILPPARAVLERLGPGDPAAVVLTGSRGGPIYPPQLSKRFPEAARRAKLPRGLGFHSLRHTFASQLVMGGADIYVVRELLRHRDVTTTQRYAHLSPARVADAAGRAMEAFTGGLSSVPRSVPSPPSSGASVPRSVPTDTGEIGDDRERSAGEGAADNGSDGTESRILARRHRSRSGTPS